MDVFWSHNREVRIIGFKSRITFELDELTNDEVVVLFLEFGLENFTYSESISIIAEE